ncbi:MAG: hypothetical protein Q7S37_03820 [bacterium]|nr:hypothetical protein [bacterium]
MRKFSKIMIFLVLITLVLGSFSFAKTIPNAQADASGRVSNLKAVTGQETGFWNGDKCYIILYWQPPSADGSYVYKVTNQNSDLQTNISETYSKKLHKTCGNTYTFNVHTMLQSSGNYDQDVGVVEITKQMKAESFSGTASGGNYAPTKFKVYKSYQEDGCPSLLFKWDWPEEKSNLDHYNIRHGQTVMKQNIESTTFEYTADKGNGWSNLPGSFSVDSMYEGGSFGSGVKKGSSTATVTGSVCVNLNTNATGGTGGGTGGTGGTSGTGGSGGTGTATGASGTGGTSGTGGSGGSGSGSGPASSSGKCEKAGWLKTVFDPLGTSIQYMQCAVLAGIDDAMGWVIKYMDEVLQVSSAKDGSHRGWGDNLAFWKVNRAHASLSSALNPDLNVASTWGTNSKATFVIKIWDTLRAFINFFVIFIIIFMAFANIFRINIDKYAVKKALPGLVLGILLANFSGFICREILDISELLQKFVTGGHAPATIVLGALKVFAVPTLLTIIGGIALGAGAILPFVFILVLIFGIALLLAGLIILFALTLRVGIIFALYAISPLAFLCLGSPLTTKMFQKWWNEFINWAFVPVAMYFVLSLAMQAGDALGSYAIIRMVMVLALIWTAVFMPFKLKGWLGGAVAGFAMGSLLKPAGKYGLAAGKGLAGNTIDNSSLKKMSTGATARGLANRFQGRGRIGNYIGGGLDKYAKSLDKISWADVLTGRAKRSYQKEKKRFEGEREELSGAGAAALANVVRTRNPDSAGSAYRVAWSQAIKRAAARTPGYNKTATTNEIAVNGEDMSDATFADYLGNRFLKNASHDDNDWMQSVLDDDIRSRTGATPQERAAALKRRDGFLHRHNFGKNDTGMTDFLNEVKNNGGLTTIQTSAMLTRRATRLQQGLDAYGQDPSRASSPEDTELVNIAVEEVANAATSNAQNRQMSHTNAIGIDQTTGQPRIAGALEQAQASLADKNKLYSQGGARGESRLDQVNVEIEMTDAAGKVTTDRMQAVDTRQKIIDGEAGLTNVVILQVAQDADMASKQETEQWAQAHPLTREIKGQIIARKIILNEGNEVHLHDGTPLAIDTNSKGKYRQNVAAAVNDPAKKEFRADLLANGVIVPDPARTGQYLWGGVVNGWDLGNGQV